MWKISYVLILFILAVAVQGCSKKKDEKENTETCPITNYFLKADISNKTWCANTTLFANYAIVMTINGISSSGGTLTLELDDVQTGSYQITKDRNHILYTDPMAVGYESTNDNPGSLVILSNDSATNIIQGSFNVNLRSPLTGNLEVKNGSFKLFYTE
ncbi:MAG: hypothetical protein LC117_04825 [Bacteroidia bacterium]|nr:hypothetical protein [Bacteroidia bacterium]MCZ2277233.1 hypothetical protein [Bacteroidia bacterium]